MGEAKQRLYIGTSGWMYRHWKDGWYGDPPQRKWLAFDAERFTGIEIDGTFYGSKPKPTFEKWAAEAPDGFKFAVRGHRYVTHFRRLKNVADSIKRVKESAEGLGDKLGPILWQTRPDMEVDLDRLKSFADDLEVWPRARHVLEFRNESWFTSEVCELLADRRLAICISDGEGIPRWDEVSTDLAYIRLHGRPELYASDYGEKDLASWAKRIRSLPVREVHVYFDNDVSGHAPHNALRLMELVKSPRPTRS